MTREPDSPPNASSASSGVWIIGTARHKLVERRTSNPGETVDDEVLTIPVEPFHAVRLGDNDGRSACGATVHVLFEEMEFGTRAQNCPRCQAAICTGDAQ